MRPRALIGRDRDAPLQAALASRGIDSLCVRLLDIAAVAAPDLAGRLARAQAVLLTSANAVPALAGARAGLPVADLPVLAVGDATAEAARDAGFTAVESARGDAAALAALARRRIERRSDRRAGPLLYLRGADVAGDLTQLLPEFQIDQAVVYRATPVPTLAPAARAALRGDGLDLALFFSPRSAAGFVSLVRASGLGENCRKTALVALSPAVARAADLPWTAAYVAPHPSRPGMLAAVDRWALDRRDHSRGHSRGQ
jgi:uroporphyrinogen-III synthase